VVRNWAGEAVFRAGPSPYEIQELPTLFSGETPIADQFIDLAGALLDRRRFAGEVGVADDQSHRLLEPLEIS
jgi:hypothetical protein